MAKSSITRVIALEVALANLPTTVDNYEEIKEKLEGIKASIEKKNATKSSKPSANQVANEGIKAVILETLATATEPITIAELKALTAELAQYETSKRSQLLRQLYVADLCNGQPKVIRTEAKGKAYFALAETN